MEDETGNSTDQNFTISVLSNNFVPEILESGHQVSEISVQIAEDSVWEKAFHLLVNDEDNQRHFWQLLDEPSSGSVSILSTGRYLDYVRYVPDANFSGQDEFKISVNDEIDEVDVIYKFEVLNVEDPPIILSDINTTLNVKLTQKF